MLGRFSVFIIHCWRSIINLWRRIWRRRVDYVRLALSGNLAEFSDAPPCWQRMLLGSTTPLSVSIMRQLLIQIASSAETQRAAS